jgi:hypothetical protein
VPTLPRDELKIDDVDDESEDHNGDETSYMLRFEIRTMKSGRVALVNIRLSSRGYLQTGLILLGRPQIGEYHGTPDKHPEYTARIGEWTQMRDTYSGRARGENPCG